MKIVIKLILFPFLLFLITGCYFNRLNQPLSYIQKFSKKLSIGEFVLANNFAECVSEFKKHDGCRKWQVESKCLSLEKDSVYNIQKLMCNELVSKNNVRIFNSFNYSSKKLFNVDSLYYLGRFEIDKNHSYYLLSGLKRPKNNYTYRLGFVIGNVTNNKIKEFISISWLDFTSFRYYNRGFFDDYHENGFYIKPNNEILFYHIPKDSIKERLVPSKENNYKFFNTNYYYINLQL